jgi:hypothetical protein
MPDHRAIPEAAAAVAVVAAAARIGTKQFGSLGVSEFGN